MRMTMIDNVMIIKLWEEVQELTRTKKKLVKSGEMKKEHDKVKPPQCQNDAKWKWSD